MQAFNFNTAKSIRFGQGISRTIGDIVSTELGSRVLVVTDEGMVKTGIIDGIGQVLRESRVDHVLYDKVEADPSESIILDAISFAESNNIDSVIGIGGGSSLDVAKLVALLTFGNQSLPQVYGVGNAKGPRLPLAVVPTTSGTGSEVTPISIVTTGTNEKMGVVSPVIIPDIAILDPELTIGLPSHITAATGIDAMVHAIEAYTSASDNNNPISQLLAEKALALIGQSLLRAVNDGSDIDARSNMLLASTFAGQAFANSPVAAVHALAYPLGGHFHIPHGLSNALVLPHVLRFNCEVAPEPYAHLAPITFPELNDVPLEQRARAYCDSLEKLSVACGLQQSLREMDTPENALPSLAKDAMNQTRLLVNNPRPVTESDALTTYKAAYNGR